MGLDSVHGLEHSAGICMDGDTQLMVGCGEGGLENRETIRNWRWVLSYALFWLADVVSGGGVEG